MKKRKQQPSFSAVGKLPKPTNNTPGKKNNGNMKGVKKANLPQKIVSPVKSPLPGAKNGRTFGLTLNIAQTNAGAANVNFLRMTALARI